MRYSKLFGKTNKTAKNFESTNATLLIKAGFIDQVMAGVYTYLPLGLKVLSKIENIVRNHMDKISSEVLMPSLAPKENWAKTGRLEKVDVLMQAIGANPISLAKNDNSYVLSPTHEELVTPLVQKFTTSYKQLPLAVYQIQTKYRNEPRAKSGLLRCREFRMKDLYSFHTNQNDLKEYYEVVKTAYNSIFKELGIGDDTVIALASGGDFTEDFSHEFQTRCDSGEDLIFYSPKAKIYYNLEVAPSKSPDFVQSDTTENSMQEVFGENIIGTKKIAEFLKIEIERTTKTIFYTIDDDKMIAAAVRGDYEINEIKLKKIVGTKKLELASAEKIREFTGSEVGYAGIINLRDDIQVFADDSIKGRKNFEMGANKTNMHLINVNFGRDLPEPTQYYDFKNAKEGDIFPETNELYEVFKASEVGNIFPLHTKFSDQFGFKYITNEGKEEPVYMGCYGLGTSRVLGVIVEKFHDEKGLIWPINIAPYKVHLIGLNLDNDSVLTQANELYSTLIKEGIEVLFDDRVDVNPGTKFADCDLIGIPIRLVVSARNNGQIEFSLRSTPDNKEMIDEDLVIEKIKLVTNIR